MGHGKHFRKTTTMETTSHEIRKEFEMSERKRKVLKFWYWVMFRLMDVESIMWWIADVLIYPIALLRRVVAKHIDYKLKQ